MGRVAGQALLEEAGDLSRRASFSASPGPLGEAGLNPSAGQEREGTARPGHTELSCHTQALTKRCWGGREGRMQGGRVAGRYR